ncbi:MAG: ASTRA complex subunit [Chaenotheca gracillima]|nr:MAG: ASTRA complex subunit [Chaenotheca gracillima]
MYNSRRYPRFVIFGICAVLGLYYLWKEPDLTEPIDEGAQPLRSLTFPPKIDDKPHWQKQSEQYPVASYTLLPTGLSQALPKIQYQFRSEDVRTAALRRQRRDKVRNTFERSWKAYKQHAWLWDELEPASGRHRDNFCGWAVTLVDTLDTLWIMDMKQEFAQAVAAVATLDFTTATCDTISLFETTIRVLGGLLGAYDISGELYPELLAKATEIGEVLYSAFDTPNRMPMLHWDWQAYTDKQNQRAGSRVPVADLGSLTLEFTRLSQLTKQPKFFDAVQRISDQFDKAQEKTKLPGMWPTMVDARTPDFTSDNSFTTGAMADSLYEYLPKQYMLLGGQMQQSRKMYESSIKPMKEHIFYRPMTKGNHDILLSGDVLVKRDGKPKLKPNSQHLGCFAGGMVGIGAKIFGRTDELDVARRLTDGCIWAYQNTVSGLMPETFTTIPCKSKEACEWDESKWIKEVRKTHLYDVDAPSQQVLAEEALAPGFTSVEDKRYLLRPEAIESVFIMYRISGDRTLQDRAWDMWEAISNMTSTKLANAPVLDVTRLPPSHVDSMESFWMAETLKYFYLIFSEPDLVSLDDFVL